jgi:hypothetical protein
MVCYLAGQKYWLTLLNEMMTIKRGGDFGHAKVILFSNQVANIEHYGCGAIQSGLQAFQARRKGGSKSYKYDYTYGACRHQYGCNQGRKQALGGKSQSNNVIKYR